jgi:hypothetical protein
MGREGLKNRNVWQDYSGANDGNAEKHFFDVFKAHFKNSDFRIREKPNEMQNIYVSFPLSPEVSAEIYNPTVTITKHGITPDYAIDNTKTGKTLYVEVKRQDGWVEGGERKDGRGNAHERSCKYFTPGLLHILRYHGHIAPPTLPFWVVFQGDITRDPCRVREIHCWFAEYKNHFFLWSDKKTTESIVVHFETKLMPLLL